MHHHVVPAHQHQFAFRSDLEPVLSVQPGTVVRIETSPEPAERLFRAGRNWPRIAAEHRINAVTGPISIQGVEPGDAVGVEILAIETLDWGWCAALPGSGLLGQYMREPLLRRIPVDGCPHQGCPLLLAIQLSHTLLIGCSPPDPVLLHSKLRVPPALGRGASSNTKS